jgi:signal transduction histidine kinase
LESYKQQAISLINFGAQQLRNPLYLLDLDGLERTIDSIKQNHNIQSVYVMYPDGRVITDGTSENKYYNQTLNDEFGIKSRKLADNSLVEIDKDHLHVFAPVAITEKVGMVRADFSLKVLDDILNNLIITLAMIGGIVSIIVIIMGLFISNSISKPIIRLRDAANEITKGNFNVDIREVKSNDEIGELSSQFQNMKESIISMNKYLNRIVQERTRQLQTANEELKKLDELKDEFINIAAHELRTPIQPILSLSEILQSQIKEAEGQELINIIIRNAKRLQKLTQDILDVTKIETRSLKLNKERFNLNDLISSIVEEYKNELKKDNGNIRLLYTPIRHSVNIEADKSKITQVLSNLIDNAVKFIEKEEEGTISINIEKKEDDCVTISVKDTGTGIDSEILSKLFTKFTSKSFSGTGLGLFISKGIIEAHGGKMWAENNFSRGEKGATFYFVLPLLADNQRIKKLPDYYINNNNNN